MVLVRVLRQLFPGVVRHVDVHWRRVWAGSPPALAMIVLITFVLTTFLAEAIPGDPTWIAGLYDAADFDDVVELLTDANLAVEPPVPPVTLTPSPDRANPAKVSAA